MRTRLFFMTLFFFASLMQAQQVEFPIAQVYDQDEDEGEAPDVWYGPGFYYGVWFATEANYWQWRSNHPYYPPNHNYYNANHPVYYNHNEDHENHGDHGDHGGGGHRGGHVGGHGGGHGR
jgi:hypothetical protein